MVRMLVNWHPRLHGWPLEPQYSELKRLEVPEEEVEVEISREPEVDEELMKAAVVGELAAPTEMKKKAAEVQRSLAAAEEERRELRSMKASVSLVEAEVSCRSAAAVVLLSEMLLRQTSEALVHRCAQSF